MPFVIQILYEEGKKLDYFFASFFIPFWSQYIILKMFSLLYYYSFFMYYYVCKYVMLICVEFKFLHLSTIVCDTYEICCNSYIWWAVQKRNSYFSPNYYTIFESINAVSVMIPIMLVFLNFIQKFGLKRYHKYKS